MIMETERLRLRPWQDSDIDSLYLYAKDPAVGPICGWMPHKDREESRWVLEHILMVPETYAVELKATGEAIGSISLMFGEAGNMPLQEGECELGYWLGVPYWGQGLMPEAAKELLRHAFEDLDCKIVWCGYYEGNTQSRRVIEKCGFTFDHRAENEYCRAMNEYRIGYNYCLRRENWIK